MLKEVSSPPSALAATLLLPPAASSAAAEFASGAITPAVVSFVNDATVPFNVSFIWAVLTNPLDPEQRPIYNFSVAFADEIVAVDTESSFEYRLAMPPLPEDLDARLSIFIQYTDASKPAAKRPHVHIAYNGTATFKSAPESPFQLKQYLPYVLGSGLALALLLLVREAVAGSAPISGSKRAAGAAAAPAGKATSAADDDAAFDIDARKQLRKRSAAGTPKKGEAAAAAQ